MKQISGAFLYEMLIGLILGTTLGVMFGLSAFAEDSSCSTTREYITTLEYLRAHHELAIQDTAAQELALKVSKGCTGAAQRFAKVAATLNHAGVVGQNAINVALEFAPLSDLETEVFISVFLKSYLEEYLNLDLATSLKLARGLTLELNEADQESNSPTNSTEDSDLSDADLVRDFSLVKLDFEKLVLFCTGEQQLNLPRPECARFAFRLVQHGGDFAQGIADSFLKLFQFLTSSSGVGLSTGKALELAEHLVVDGGERSDENFISAFKYAIASTGLKLDAQAAYHFAERMTVSNSESHDTQKSRSSSQSSGESRAPSSLRAHSSEGRSAGRTKKRGPSLSRRSHNRSHLHR